MDAEWEDILWFLFVRSSALSDHAPLLLDPGERKLQGKTPQLKFELGWFCSHGDRSLEQAGDWTKFNPKVE